MELPTHVLSLYGYLLLFAWVLVEQLGIPLPATPVLLAAGALSAAGPFSFPLALAASLSAALTADTAWFLIGRRYGHHVLRILCKLSLEPTTCVRRTQDSFGRRRGSAIDHCQVHSRARTSDAAGGRARTAWRIGSFLFYDGIGAALWVGALLAAGRLFGDLLKRNPSLLNWAGRFSGALLVLGIAGFLLGRVWRRRMVLKKLAAARLEPEELKQRLDAGEEVSSWTCAIRSNCCPTPLRCPARSTFRPRLSPRATRRFPATATSCSIAHAPARPPRPKPP